MAGNCAVLFGALGLASLAGCASYGSSVQGQVFEVDNPNAPMLQWKKVPVSGAFVVVVWNGTIPQPAHAGSVCLNSAITRTDDRGQFTVPSWWALPRLYPVIDVKVDVAVYKPGFEQKTDYGDVVLAKVPRPPKDRLYSLVIMSEIGCEEGKAIRDPGNNLNAYYQALYEEARDLGAKDWEWMLNSLRRKSNSTDK